MGKVKKNKQPIRVVSWEEYQKMVDTLAKKIIDHNKKMLFECPEILVWGIPRGGTVVAVSISHYDGKLFNYWNNDPVKYDGYEGLIVVDDIVDSGNTATPYVKLYPVASLFVREGASFEPDWYVEKLKDDTWIKFPWEKNT